MAQMTADSGQSRHSRLTATVLRAMSIFGGLQAVQILCSLVRAKLVAVWIGPAGVGLFGIYNSAIEMMSTLSQLGLRESAVRDVASAPPSRVALIVAVIRRWAWLLGLLGALLTLGCAPLLSRLSFGDTGHSGGFALLAVVLLFTSLTGGEQAVMQGLKHLRRLAVSSLWGVTAGLAVSVPMFYFWGIDSVIPSIIAYAVVGCAAAMLYRAPAQRPPVPLTPSLTLSTGRGFIALGAYMTVSIFAGMLASYLFMSYLNTTADTVTVGYYQAGYQLFNRYVGLIFTAISMEFYPRLATVARSRRRTSVFVSHELGLALWVLIPVICLFVTLARPIVSLLYSADFLVIVPFISLGIIGTILRAASWCMAFTILARGDGPTFLVTEITSAIVCLPLNIAGYHLGGLAGLGLSYIVWYAVYTAVVAVVYRRRYRLSLTPAAMRLTLAALAVTAAATAATLLVSWMAGAVIAAAATIVSAHHLLAMRHPSKPA